MENKAEDPSDNPTKKPAEKSGHQPAGEPKRAGSLNPGDAVHLCDSASAVATSDQNMRCDPALNTGLPAGTVRAPDFVEPDDLAAMGGTVGSIVLGAIALIGSMFSAYASITALLGIAMGLWGLHSRRRFWAGIGLTLNGVVLVLILNFFVG